jgi:hypothetical protein
VEVLGQVGESLRGGEGAEHVCYYRVLSEGGTVEGTEGGDALCWWMLDGHVRREKDGRRDAERREVPLPPSVTADSAIAFEDFG